MGARRTVRAYVGLGANVGDAARTLTWAVAALDELPDVAVRAVSRLYATTPWGVVDQPEFRNAAVAIAFTTAGGDAATEALRLLTSLKTVERRAGRRRRRRWGPRELDLDLLVFGRHRIDVEREAEARSIDADGDPAKASRRLEVPHRDLGERLFVLAPLADLAASLVPPGWRETIETRRRLVAAAGPSDAVRVVADWDADARRWRPGSISPAAGWAGPRARRPR